MAASASPQYADYKIGECVTGCFVQTLVAKYALLPEQVVSEYNHREQNP